MTLKEFIGNLKILSEKYPTAIVVNPELFSITVKSTLYSDSSPRLVYDWRTAAELEQRESFNRSLQNSLTNHDHTTQKTLR